MKRSVYHSRRVLLVKHPTSESSTAKPTLAPEHPKGFIATGIIYVAALSCSPRVEVASLQLAEHDRHAVHRHWHAGVIPLGLITWPGQFEPVLAQQAVQDHLDL